MRRKEIHPLTPDQVKVLLATAAATGDRLEALYVLAIHTGLRQGELLGLKWDDVNLDNGALQVRRSLSVTKDGLALSSPKTKVSSRSVQLTSEAVSALQEHLKRQLKER